MLYLATGNDEFAIKEFYTKQKNNFIQKHGEFNFAHLKDIARLDINFLIENISSTSFMGGNKLIIIDLDSSFFALKEENLEKYKKIIIENLDKIPESNFVIFNYPNPDKRTSFYKKLSSSCKISIFDIPDIGEIQSKISQMYEGKIENNALQLLIQKKGYNYYKIINEINKLLIFSDFIDSKIVSENVVPELDESVFKLVDLILAGEYLKVIEIINILLDSTTIFAIYNMILSNLRFYIYIYALKEKGYSVTQIKSILDLGARSWLVDKLRSINYKKLQNLYFDLIQIDSTQKSGELIGTKDEDFLYELQKVFLKHS